MTDATFKKKNAILKRKLTVAQKKHAVEIGNIVGQIQKLRSQHNHHGRITSAREAQYKRPWRYCSVCNELFRK